MENSFLIILIVILVVTALNRNRSHSEPEESSEGEKPMSWWERILFSGIVFTVICLALFMAAVLYEDSNPGNAITASGDIPWKKEQRIFGVKVLPHGSSSTYYQIVYTNNGFLTTENLNEFLDYNNTIQLWLGDKKEAVRIASSISSYEDCILFNKHVQELQDPGETIIFTKSDH